MPMSPTPLLNGQPTAPPDLAGPRPVAEVARCLDAILFSFLALIAARFVLLGPLMTPVWTRISRTRQRLFRLLTRIAAGHLPRPPRASGAPPRRSGTSAPFPNRRHGWLAIMLDHNARNHASQLRYLLHTPGVAEIIAASPGALRTLRPLCQMLGVDLPLVLRPPARPPAPPRQRPPPSQTAQLVASPLARIAPPDPPDRPIPRNILAAARYWRRRTAKIA